jgi:hypothetical protein
LVYWRETLFNSTARAIPLGSPRRLILGHASARDWPASGREFVISQNGTWEQLLCKNDFLFPQCRGFPQEYAFNFAGILVKARISMNLLRFRHAAAMVTALFLIPASFAQVTGGDKVDLDALAQIKTEAFQHSQVMETLFWMSEVYGARVTNSRNHKLAAEFRRTM